MTNAQTVANFISRLTADLTDTVVSDDQRIVTNMPKRLRWLQHGLRDDTVVSFSVRFASGAAFGAHVWYKADDDAFYGYLNRILDVRADGCVTAETLESYRGGLDMVLRSIIASIDEMQNY